MYALVKNGCLYASLKLCYMYIPVYCCTLQLFWGLPFLPLHRSIPWTGVRPTLFPESKHNIWAAKMHFGSHLPRYFKHALYNPFKISIWCNACCTHREYKVMPRKKRLKHNKQEERRRRKGFKKKVTEVRNTWLLCILQEIHFGTWYWSAAFVYLSWAANDCPAFTRAISFLWST